MTKAEIVAKMADDAGITKAAAQTCMESFIATVTQALKKKDGKVTLVGSVHSKNPAGKPARAETRKPAKRSKSRPAMS